MPKRKQPLDTSKRIFIPSWRQTIRHQPPTDEEYRDNTWWSVVKGFLYAGTDNPPFWRSGQEVCSDIFGYFGGGPEYTYVAHCYIKHLRDNDPTGGGWYFQEFSYHRLHDWSKYPEYPSCELTEASRNSWISRIIEYEEREAQRLSQDNLTLKIAASIPERQTDTLIWLQDVLVRQLGLVHPDSIETYGPDSYENKYWVKARLNLPAAEERLIYAALQSDPPLLYKTEHDWSTHTKMMATIQEWRDHGMVIEDASEYQAWRESQRQQKQEV